MTVVDGFEKGLVQMLRASSATRMGGRSWDCELERSDGRAISNHTCFNVGDELDMYTHPQLRWARPCRRGTAERRVSSGPPARVPATGGDIYQHVSRQYPKEPIMRGVLDTPFRNNDPVAALLEAALYQPAPAVGAGILAGAFYLAEAARNASIVGEPSVWPWSKNISRDISKG